jgi:hypothetical protein
MHTRLLALAALLALVPALGAGDAKPLTFVNSTVSSRTISLNEPLRVEFTTMARQLPEIDIPGQVRAAITVGAARSWRLVGAPLVTEHEKTRTVQIAVALLPRTTGALDLPTIPLTWLKSSGVAGFGQVTVSEDILVGSERKALPAELTGVAKVPWGAAWSEWKDRLPGATTGAGNGASWIRTDRGVELRFTGGELGEATLPAPGLTLDAARASFLTRWGAPHQETPTTLTWWLGWTRITATAGDGATTVLLVREDHAAKQDARRVETGVFDALEGSGTPVAPAGIDPAKEFERLRSASATTAR